MVGQFGTSGDLANDDTFVWTFSTNRNWGESTNCGGHHESAHRRAAGGPGSFDFTPGIIPQPIFRDWELHLENWSNSAFILDGFEIVWHGKPIAGGQLDQDWLAEDADWKIPVAQRIQGFVGIDIDNDDEFSGIDPTARQRMEQPLHPDILRRSERARQTEMQRRLLDDFEDNDFNGVFDRRRRSRTWSRSPRTSSSRRFEFTVDGGGNDIVNDAAHRAVPDRRRRQLLLRPRCPAITSFAPPIATPSPARRRRSEHAGSDYLQHYKDEWRITEDWFFAPDRDV